MRWALAKSAYHEPLKPEDTEFQTVGCRHTNPDICAKHSLAKVCAFVKPDGICAAPPASWSKQFLKLRTSKTDTESGK